MSAPGKRPLPPNEDDRSPKKTKATPVVIQSESEDEEDAVEVDPTPYLSEAQRAALAEKKRLVAESMPQVKKASPAAAAASAPAAAAAASSSSSVPGAAAASGSKGRKSKALVKGPDPDVYGTFKGSPNVVGGTITIHGRATGSPFVMAKEFVQHMGLSGSGSVDAALRNIGVKTKKKASGKIYVDLACLVLLLHNKLSTKTHMFDSDACVEWAQGLMAEMARAVTEKPDQASVRASKSKAAAAAGASPPPYATAPAAAAAAAAGSNNSPDTPASPQQAPPSSSSAAAAFSPPPSSAPRLSHAGSSISSSGSNPAPAGGSAASVALALPSPSLRDAPLPDIDVEDHVVVSRTVTTVHTYAPRR